MKEAPSASSGGGIYRPADFATLTQALDYAAQGQAGLNFYSGKGDLLEALNYSDLRGQAQSLARRMRNAGLDAGERVAIIAETDGNFARAFFACQYAGLVPVPMPLPMAFGGKAGYISHIRRMIESAGASAALCPEALREMTLEATNGLALKAVGALEVFDLYADDGALLPDVTPDQLSYLQYSSGSTRFPLGVAVTQKALLSNCRAITAHGLKIVASDRCVSWLPFYHDMGLVGFLLVPVATQMSVDYVSTREFARRPLVWPTLISRNGGTLSFSPSFGYDLCARRGASGARPANLDLSRWRVAGIGGDMIRDSVMSHFAESFAHSGFRRQAFVASYGMAEATLAISFAPLATGIETDNIDLDQLETSAIATSVKSNGNGNGSKRSRNFVFCGPVLPGHDLEIRDPAGNVLGERQAGRVMVRGPSLMREYFGNQEETSRALSADGWLDTGDLGYLSGGALVITGRSKDLILVNGRNVWPQDLEWAVEHEVDGLRSGDVAAFSVDEAAAERVVLLAHCRKTSEIDREGLRQAIIETIRAKAGLDCEVMLVAPHSLPQTSSGKLSRTQARELYLAGEVSVKAGLNNGSTSDLTLLHQA
ncbi:MAG: fatty acyl-AMP ligase [Alphaproteobacteria bacterium]|nr:fatty acyl-AMP ligase [Alphaproteobacteria bacterium]